MGAPNLPPQLTQWLSRVLSDPKYQNPHRIFTDTVSVLIAYPSLQPRTEVFTHDNGTSDLLLNIYGTLPTIFRGAQYNFPISIWIPRIYPAAPPNMFVTPPAGMLISPGNHVDLSGRCYHPYLANWANNTERSNLVDLCEVFKGIFAREAPVYAKPRASNEHPKQQGPPAPPPKPPIRSEINQGNTQGQHRQQQQQLQPETQPDVPPPLPPLPVSFSAHPTSASPVPPRSALPLSPQLSTPPPLPPHPNVTQQTYYSQISQPLDARPPSVLTPQQGRPSISQPHHAYNHASSSTVAPTSPSRYSQPPPLPPQSGPPQYQQRPMHPVPLPPHHGPPPPQYQTRPGYAHWQGSPQPLSPQKPAVTSPLPVKKPMQPDLLDEPPVSSVFPEVTPPPPPPNPEKDRVLQEIRNAIAKIARDSTEKVNSHVAVMNSQREAMSKAESNMEAELGALHQIQNDCAQDNAILTERIRMAEEVINEAKTRELPDVDTLLTATSVVHNQLYDLICEDKAIQDCIYALGKVLDRSRGNDGQWEQVLWQVRKLAREQFLIRATAKKIADLIGLEG